MTSARVLCYLIVSICTVLQFGNCENLFDCKTLVVNDAELRNDLLQRSLNFYQNYDLKLEFEDYYMNFFSHMCDETNSICDIKLHFENSTKPYLHGKFEEKYIIDESGKHVTINGTWNPYSSIFPYNFEKVDDGFNFYTNSTNVWFHVSIDDLTDALPNDFNMTAKEITHLLRLRLLRKSAFQLLESLEGDDKFVEYRNWSFGVDSNSLRFQKYPEIELFFTKTLEKMSFDEKDPVEPVKFVCVNGDYNTYKIDLKVGRQLKSGYSRDNCNELKTSISGENITSVEQDFESDCYTMVQNDAKLRSDLFQRSLSFLQNNDLKLDYGDNYIYLLRHMCYGQPPLCYITLLFKNTSDLDSTGKFQEKYKFDKYGEHITINGVWHPTSSLFPYKFENVYDGGFNFYKNTSNIWFHGSIDHLSINLSDFRFILTDTSIFIALNTTDDESNHLQQLQKLRESVIRFISTINRPDKFFEYKNSTLGLDFDSLRFQDYPDIQVSFTKKIEKTAVNPGNPFVTFKCINGAFSTYKIDLAVGGRLFYGYFRVT